MYRLHPTLESKQNCRRKSNKLYALLIEKRKSFNLEKLANINNKYFRKALRDIFGQQICNALPDHLDVDPGR